MSGAERLIVMQVIDLFPLCFALHAGGGPLDLEIRGWRGFSLAGGCVRVPCAGIVGSVPRMELIPEILDVGIETEENQAWR